MKTVTEHLRDRILAKCFTGPAIPDLAVLRKTERSPEFERYCRNRLIMGAFRYGRLGQPGKPEYDRVACMIRRLEAYRADGNAEHLCDVANLAMIEFVEGRHKGICSVDDGEHTKQKEKSCC